MRDFVHIDDCVACILGTMDKIDDGTALNISSGELTSFIDLAAMVLRLAGKRAEIKTQGDKPEGVFARGGDRGLQSQHGFFPRVGLEEGITKVLDHLRNREF